jgi:hypothetical protein
MCYTTSKIDNKSMRLIYDNLAPPQQQTHRELTWRSNSATFCRETLKKLAEQTQR